MEHVISLLSLSAMEIVLGIDNLVFIAIVVAKLPAAQQEPIRRIGLILALGLRLLLLLAISWVMGLTAPWLTIGGFTLSGRAAILLAGGLFLIAKATFEIHDKLEGGAHTASAAAPTSHMGVLVQILLLDLVFSLDSVITAVGMAQHIWIMVAAMMLAMGVMLLAARHVSDFVERHPTVKMLALAFLLLIGVMLVAESTGAHVDKGYIYFAMAFSLGVELLNMRWRKKAQRAALTLLDGTTQGLLDEERGA